MAGRKSMATFRSLAGLFTVAFAGALVVLALLGNYGLPDTVLGTTLGVGVVIAFALAGVSERTMQPVEFHTAGGGLSALANGIAMAAAFLSAGALFGIAAAVFSDFRAGIAITLGWSLGFLLLAVLIAPYLRKSGTFGAADFLAFRFGNRGVRLVAAVIVVLTLIPALAAAIATGTLVAGRLFALSPHAATALVVLLILSGTVLGGMRAVTLTALAQYIVLAIAFVVPIAIVSTIAYSLPLPQIAAGLAYHDAAMLAASSGGLAAPLASRFLPLVPEGSLQLIAMTVGLATGVAALPHLLMRCATVDDAPSTRRSVGWALIFVLVVALTAPAYATFAKLALLRDVVGSAIADLPDWLFALGRQGLVALCGADATSAAAAAQACATLHGTAGPVSAPDLVVSGDIVVLAWGDIVDLPYVVTALILVGALAAVLAAANAITLALSEALGHDLYARLVDTRASAGRRLIVTRLLLVATVLGAAWLGVRHSADIFPLAAATLVLSAGGLFPALFLAVWWRRTNGPGAIAGMIAGFAVTLAIVVGGRYPGLLPVDAQGSGLSPLFAAIIGLPIGFVVAIAVSLATRAPSPSEAAAVDAMRRPGNTFVAADI
jgi:cation/acetate symporter